MAQTWVGSIYGLDWVGSGWVIFFVFSELGCAGLGGDEVHNNLFVGINGDPIRLSDSAGFLLSGQIRISYLTPDRIFSISSVLQSLF